MTLDATKGREIQQSILFLYFRGCDKKITTITTTTIFFNDETLYIAIERGCIIVANIVKPSLHVNNSQ